MNLQHVCRVIYAPNIHHGGGKALLFPLLDELKNAEDVLFILDNRMELPEDWPQNTRLIHVKPTIGARLSLEFKLRSLLRLDMAVLCMGNLPPLFASTPRMILFVQNFYIAGRPKLSGFLFSTKLRITMERIWFKLRVGHASRLVVQTTSMQNQLRHLHGIKAEILPFIEHSALPQLVDLSEKKEFDFIYVASGDPHKNHRNLILAWVELAHKGSFPSLALTLNEGNYPQLLSWIENTKQRHGLQITNLGEIQPSQVCSLYQRTRALIYPSLFESFGLPLIEAASAGLPILPSDRRYVRDVIKPQEVFEPEAPGSIAVAVKSFGFEPSPLTIDVLDATDFINTVFNSGDFQ